MFLEAFTLSLGLGLSSDIETSDNFTTQGRMGYHLKLEHDPSDFSLWGSYYKKNHYAVGQPIFESGLWAVGIGYDIDLTQDLEITLGLGWGGHTNANVQQAYSGGKPSGTFPSGDVIVGEAAFTYLVSRHQNDGRDIPLPLEEYENYNQGYGSGWKHRQDIFGRIGITYNISSQWEIGAQVNIFNPKSNMWIARNEIAQDFIDDGLKSPNFNPCQYAGGCGLWVEDTSWGMNSFEITISYQW